MLLTIAAAASLKLIFEIYFKNKIVHFDIQKKIVKIIFNI